jgi:hypothetical protein
LWTFLCFNWKFQCMRKCMVVLPTHFATDHSDGATLATERTPWWRHQGRAETCRFSNVWCVYILLHVKLVMKINPSFRSSNQNSACISVLPPIHATCPAHLMHLDLTTPVIFWQRYISRSFSFWNIPHSVTSSLLGPNIFSQHHVLLHPQPLFS